MEYYEPHEDFDYEQVFKNLDNEPDKELDWEKESLVLNSLLDFIAPPRFKKNVYGGTLCRIYALLWVLRPHFFGNPSITQTEVANLIGVSKQIFGQHVTELRNKFGVMVNGQRTDEARQKFSEICKARADELAQARRAADKKRKNKKNEK